MSHALFLSFDDRFANFAIACLNSVRANYPDHPDIVACYTGKRADMAALLDKMGARRLRASRRVRDAFADAPPGPVASLAVYDRLMIWAEDFDEYDNILYLDVDTLVLKPLDDLVGANEFVAVPNHEPAPDVRVFDPALAGDPSLDMLLKEDGLAWPGDMDDMINAGVLLVPPAARSKEQYRLLYRLYTRYRPWLHYADQSLLSLWCASNGFRPQNRYNYNFQSPFFTDDGIDLALKDIAILHFSSERKPLTDAFRRWERVGAIAARLEALYREYLYLPI